VVLAVHPGAGQLAQDPLGLAIVFADSPGATSAAATRGSMRDA